MTGRANHLLTFLQFDHMQVFLSLLTLSCGLCKIIVMTVTLAVPDLPAIAPLWLLPTMFVKRFRTLPGLLLLTSDHYAREENLHYEQVTRRAMIAPRPSRKLNSWLIWWEGEVLVRRRLTDRLLDLQS